jgi:hypothetical protein
VRQIGIALAVLIIIYAAVAFYLGDRLLAFIALLQVTYLTSILRRFYT